MKNYLLGFTIFVLCPYVNAQSGELTLDANNKQISQTKAILEKYSIESLTDFFYNNIGNVKEHDKIISYRFYQITPYYKFKSLMNEKEMHCGKLVKKEILKIDYSNDKKEATVFLKVKYLKIDAMEQIIFTKDSEKDNFNIIEYTVQ